MLPLSKDPQKIVAVVIAVLAAFWLLRSVDNALELGVEHAALEESIKDLRAQHKKLKEDIKNMSRLACLNDAERAAADARWAEATRAQERLAEENARRSRDAMKSIPKLNFQ